MNEAGTRVWVVIRANQAESSLVGMFSNRDAAEECRQYTETKVREEERRRDEMMIAEGFAPFGSCDWIKVDEWVARHQFHADEGR